MNNDAKLYLIFETLFTQKKYAEYIRYFVENQEQYKRATTLDNEKKLQILNWLAESFVQEKDLVQAKRFFDYLTKVAPTDSRAYLSLINLIKDEKNWQELIGVCQSAQMHCPEMWLSYWWTGHAYKFLKQFDKAEEQFNILNSQFPNLHQGVEGLTEVFYNLKDWQQAIKYGLQLQVKKPDLWLSYWWTGHAYKFLKQFDKAEEQFNILNSQFPNLHQGVEGLTEVFYNLKDWQQAIKYGLQLQVKKPDLWLSYWWTGHAYKFLKQFDKAEEQFNILNSQFPNLHQGVEGLTEVFYNLKDWQQAIKYGLQLQVKKPDLWLSYWWTGHAYKFLKQFDKAEEQFNILNSQFPNLHQGVEGLTEVFYNLKDWQQAIKYGLQLQVKKPDLWLSYWWTGHAYKFLKQFDKAEEQFNILNSQFPNLHQGVEGLTEVFYNLKDWQQAIKYGLQLQVKKPDLWLSYWWTGHAYKFLKQFDKAEEQFNILNSQFPNLHQGVEGLTEVFYNLKDWQQAIKYGLQLQVKKPDLWLSYWWTGHAYKFLKQFDKAEEQFNILNSQFPNLHQGVEGLTEVFYNLKDWQQAIKYGLQLQVKKPDLWLSYWWTGHAYKFLKQFDKAEEQFNALVEKFPTNSKGREGLEQLAKFKEIHPN